MELVSLSVVALAIIGVIAYIHQLYSKRAKDLEERNRRLTALRKLDEIMMSSTTDLLEVAQKVTDAISFELGFEIGVLALIDEEKQLLRRVAMSRTPTGLKAKQVLPIPYERLEVPLSAEQNITVQVVKTGKKKVTHDLYDVFVPALDRPTALKIQQTVQVKTSLVYPLKTRGKTIGVMIVSIAREEHQLSTYEKETIENLVDFVAMAMDNAILYQNLKVTSLKLEQANIRLQELDKLKDDFVSITSHELRTPMTAIRSYAWMALNRADVPLSDKLKKYLSRTLLSTERLINLVNDMLNISRIESGRIAITPTTFDIAQLVSEVITEVAERAKERGLSLQLIRSAAPQVFADPDKVHQVLLNLIGNALKFTNVNGKIWVDFFSDGQIVEVSIRDNGIGIAREDLPRLFTKFGRLDNSYVAAATSGGTGLGLFICKSLVEMMGGRIWADSSGLGKGSTFTFSLPAATPGILRQSAKFSRKVAGEAKTLEPVAI